MNKDRLRKLIKFIGRRSLVYLAWGCLTGIVLFCIELVFAYVLQAFLVFLGVVSENAAQLPKWLPVTSSRKFLILVGLAIAVRGCAQWAYQYLTSASFEVSRDHQRHRLIEWALRAPSVSSALLMNYFSEGTYAVSTSLSSLQGIVINVSTSVLIWAYLLHLSAPTTIAATLLIFILGFSMRLIDRPIRNEGRRLTADLEHVNKRIISSIKNLLLVKIYGTEERERNEITSRLDSIFKSLLRYQKNLYLKSVLPQTAGLLIICVLSTFAIRHNWLNRELTLAYFYLFIRFVQSFSDALKVASSAIFYMPLTKSMARWWALNAYDRPNSSSRISPERQSKKKLNALVGWNMREVSFKYEGADAHVFQRMSACLPAGKTTVITGASGGGKSTLISLILGNLQPTAGSVQIEDTNGAYFDVIEDRSILLDTVGYVGPESFIIEGTIRENILYGNQHHPSEAEIAEALDHAECKFVWQFGAGLEHFLTDQGQGLSAGQKQRLSLARALLRKPKVLILDEATSNLDAETERRLMAVLERLKASVTLVIVTHRETLLELADHRIHLDEAGRASV